MKRGDVVLLDFPFSSGAGGKVRPALIVQNDRDNQRITHSIVAMITGNLRRAGEPCHVVVDPASTDGASSGLHGKSLVVCRNLYTIEQASVLRAIGNLSDPLMSEVDQCLKDALGLA